MVDVSADKYARMPFPAQATYGDLIEFIILNVEEEVHRSVPVVADVVEEGASEASTSATKQSKLEFHPVDLEVARARDLGAVDQSYFIRSHLGPLLKVGDSVLGYDMQNMTLTCRSEELGANGQYQDVILVKKVTGDGSVEKAKSKVIGLEVAGRSYKEEAVLAEFAEADL